MAKFPVNRGVCDNNFSVKLFSVFNTSQKQLLVLARDRSTAISISQQANHIHNIVFRKDGCYPNVEEMRPSLTGINVTHREALQRAIIQRLEGTVHFIDEHLAIGTDIILT